MSRTRGVAKRFLTLVLAMAMVITMMPQVSVKAGTGSAITSFARAEGQSKGQYKNENDYYAISFPLMNGVAVNQDTYGEFSGKYVIEVQKEDGWYDITKSESGFKALTGAWSATTAVNTYNTQLWYNDEKTWNGWGLEIKVDTKTYIRFRSVDEPNVFIEYSLEESVEKIELKNESGSSKIITGPGSSPAFLFSYVYINGEAQSEQVKMLNYQIKKGSGAWQDIGDYAYQGSNNGGNPTGDGGYAGYYPPEGGKWIWVGWFMGPVQENYTIRVSLESDPTIYGEYVVEVKSTAVQAADEPNLKSTTGDVADPGKTKAGYRLVWNDEFDGNYAGANVDPKTGLNLDNWNYQMGDGTITANNLGWGNAERQSYQNSPDNIKVENGNLRITAKYEADGVSYSKDDKTEAKSYYSSARIATNFDDEGNPLFTTTYGYIEARMALPATMGAWPAFWMLPESTDIYGAWPVSGELDIMESAGYWQNGQDGKGNDADGNPLSNVCGTLHWGSPDHLYSGKGIRLENSITKFHTYAVDWEPGKITWYYDGKVMNTMTSWESKKAGASDSLSFDAPFDNPYYIILNLALDSGRFSPENVTSFEGNINMYVDYVRVFQKEGGYDTSNVKRTAVDTKDDWASYAGKNQIAEIESEDSLVVAAGGDMNSIETKADGGKGQDPTKWYLAYGEGGEAGISYVDDGDTKWAKVSVDNPGKVDYGVQLIGHYNAKAGYVYKVSFDAYAEGDLVNQMVGSDSKTWKGWSTFGNSSFDLGDEPKHYSYLVTQLTDSDECRIEFNLGKVATGSVYLGNIKVEIVDPEEISYDKPRAKGELLSGEMIYNGTFDQGINRVAHWAATEDTKFEVPANTSAALTADEVGVMDVAVGKKKYFARRAEISGKNTTAKPTIYQSGLSIPQGTYIMAMDIYSVDDVVVEPSVFAVDKDGILDYTLSSGSINVKGEKAVQRVYWEFTVGEELEDAAIGVSFGEGASVYLDNVTMMTKTKYESKNGKVPSSAPQAPKCYPIKYTLDGGVNAKNPITFTPNVPVQLQAPTRYGFKFLGWTKDSSGSSYLEENPVFKDTKEITLVANWQMEEVVIPPQEYTIRWLDEDGSPIQTTNPTKYTTGDQVTFTKPTKEGYTFAGWYQITSVSQALVTGLAGTETGNLTFTAKWTKDVVESNITYVMNNGTNSTENPSTYEEGTTVIFKAPTRAHYEFLGWTTDAAGTNKITGITAETTGDITVYAQWEAIEYTISYSAGIGATMPSDALSTYTYGSTATLPVPVMVGHNFKGWKKSSTDAEGIYQLTGTEEGNLILIADWDPPIVEEPTVYTINYVTNGGTNSIYNETSLTEGKEFIPQAATRFGYTFGGWYTSRNFATGTNVIKLNDTTIAAMNLSDTVINLYAKWPLNTYKIPYILDGGTNSVKNPAYYNFTQTILLDSPTRKGYLFAGWRDQNNQSITGIAKNSTTNYYLTATWTKVTKPSTPTIKKVKPGKKRITVTLKKSISGAAGYQYQRATRKTFKKGKKTYTVQRNATTNKLSKSKTIKKLKKGTTYYVRVRAYKLDSTGAKVYGSWSKVKKVKVTR